MSVVLDTTVVIDVLRGHGPATDYLLGIPDAPICSEVTRVEVLRGLRPTERDRAERLFQQVEWVAVDEAIARVAGTFGRALRPGQRGVSAADLIIAATAEHTGLPVATMNVRHFPMYPDLRPPYRD